MALITGKVFIVPNSLATPDEFGNGSKARLYSQFREMQFGNEEFTDDRFRRINGSDPLVEVWYTSDDSNNWCSHGHPTLEGWRVNRLPVSLFEGLSEGDGITLWWKGHTVELVLDQCNFRYRRFGRFEQVLGDLLERYHNRIAAK